MCPVFCIVWMPTLTGSCRSCTVSFNLHARHAIEVVSIPDGIGHHILRLGILLVGKLHRPGPSQLGPHLPIC